MKADGVVSAIAKNAMNENGDIRIAAAVIVDAQGRTLLVRKRGRAAYMQAGGKVAADETPAQALLREIREELDCDLAEQPVPLGCFRAPAANEPGRMVDAELFAVTLTGEICPAAEIEDAIWHDPADPDSVLLAPLTRDHVLPLLPTLRRHA
jgi:8-oxo-dGTP pyrophosphatase MutT (NUDIX family)